MKRYKIHSLNYLIRTENIIYSQVNKKDDYFDEDDDHYIYGGNRYEYFIEDVFSKGFKFKKHP